MTEKFTRYMKNPPYPSEILREDVLVPLGLSITEAARRLAISRVVKGKARISPGLAIRLEKAGVSTACCWVDMQANYDLWRVMQRKQPPVRAIQSR